MRDKGTSPLNRMAQGGGDMAGDNNDQRIGAIFVQGLRNGIRRRLVGQVGQKGNMRPGHDAEQHGRNVQRRGRDHRPAGQGQSQHQQIERNMAGVGRLALQRRKGVRQGRRGPDEPPRQPRDRQQQDDDPDRFMELEQLDHPHLGETRVFHRQPGDDQGENPQRHCPVQDGGDRIVTLARASGHVSAATRRRRGWSDGRCRQSSARRS